MSCWFQKGYTFLKREVDTVKKVKIGVLGGYRGTSMINYCKIAGNAQVVAICDKAPDVLEAQKEATKGLDITFYYNFDDFIKHDMDAVVLANYAHQHAPFAIRAMERGLHVFSEVLPTQTLKEAVELIEAVEKTGMVYAYGENYCYMPATYEMKRLYREGKVGEVEYAEGEYIHNCESIWHSITYGEKDHWRNRAYSTFYCTHSAGPIIHITGLRPVSVTGFEGVGAHRRERVGSKSGGYGIEMVTLENGATVRSIHGGLYTGGNWYSLYGSKGMMENARRTTGSGNVKKLYLRYDDKDGDYDLKEEAYLPAREFDEKAKAFGHGSSDFYSMWHFCEKILGNPDADIIDVYEALDMSLIGIFAYRSILQGGIPVTIPDLRNKEERERWKNDVSCTDPDVAGDSLLPTRRGGTPDIPDEVYERMKQKWDAERNDKSEDNYRNAALKQGSAK